MKKGTGPIFNRADRDKVTGKVSVVVVPPATSLAKTPATTNNMVSNIQGLQLRSRSTTHLVSKLVIFEPLTVPSTVKV